MTDQPECRLDVEKRMSPEFFKALSDPNRLAILARLAGQAEEQTVSEVASCCPVNISVVSRHLRTLKDAGIVEAEKRGKEVFYRVRVRDLVAALRGLADAIEACCPGELCELTGGDENA